MKDIQAGDEVILKYQKDHNVQLKQALQEERIAKEKLECFQSANSVLYNAALNQKEQLMTRVRELVAEQSVTSNAEVELAQIRQNFESQGNIVKQLQTELETNNRKLTTLSESMKHAEDQITEQKSALEEWQSAYAKLEDDLAQAVLSKKSIEPPIRRQPAAVQLERTSGKQLNPTQSPEEQKKGNSTENKTQLSVKSLLKLISKM